jgi:hypothetical protein
MRGQLRESSSITIRYACNHHLKAEAVLNFCCTQDCKEGTVDLHYLCVPEAVRYAEDELQAASRRHDRTVHFIVGTFFNKLYGVYPLHG